MWEENCGICAVINYEGLTQADIDYFTHIFKNCSKRGEDASGIVLQNLTVLKQPGSVLNFVKTNKYKQVLSSAKGLQWIVGHTRHATRGDPKFNINNHPLTDLNTILHHRERRFWMVFNGVVQPAKGLPELDLKYTDGYYISNAIRKEWTDGDLLETVRKAYKHITGYAATITMTRTQIVFARIYNPIVMCSLPNHSTGFASEGTFFPQGSYSIEDLPNSSARLYTNKKETREVGIDFGASRYTYEARNWDWEWIAPSKQTKIYDEDDEEEDEDGWVRKPEPKKQEPKKQVEVKSHIRVKALRPEEFDEFVEEDDPWLTYHRKKNKRFWRQH